MQYIPKKVHNFADIIISNGFTVSKLVLVNVMIKLVAEAIIKRIWLKTVKLLQNEDTNESRIKKREGS